MSISAQTKEKQCIEQVLKQKGIYVGTTVGNSMYPMLRNRRDTIVIRPYEGRLKKYDVPLYKRGDTYILHRIIDVLPDSYTICGDNCINREYGIKDNQIVGVLTEFYRGDKKIELNQRGYRFYVKLRTAGYPFRVWRHCLFSKIHLLLRN